MRAPPRLHGWNGDSPMTNDKPTIKRASRLRALGALAAAAWVVAGCMSTPTSAPSPEAVALERRARAAEERGDAASALQLYRQRGDMTSGAARSGYLIDAARLALTIGDTTAASQSLASAEQGADATQRQAIAVLRAE